jgi:serine/threonine protein kinase
MMKNLGSTPHPHLISLLATFSIEYNNWSMVLPLARYDLYTFWELHDGPLMETAFKPRQEDMLWVTAQITGLVSALTVIHNVGRGHDPNRQYGRHGDIKSDNVLCFPSSSSRLGTLVLSDFGLSSSHKETTWPRRDATVTETMGFTPTYRPPEYDIKHPSKAVSRRSDIWSLGCLLLEMVCWILEGKEGLVKFHGIRTVVSAATGVTSSVYFEAHKTEGLNFEFKVKKEVTEVS